MASRQERRKAERDAAKRAPAQTGAAGAGGAAAAAAFANLDVNGSPGGDWTTQEGDPNVLALRLGAKNLELKADEGDRAAQFSLGCHLMSKAQAGDGGAGVWGAASTSPNAEVWLAL